MRKMLSIFGVVCFLMACQEQINDLSQPEKVQSLVQHGWLPAFFSTKTIQEGWEIHQIDNNNLWGYIVPENLALQTNCLKAKTPLTYKKPPRAMRQYWADEQTFVKSNHYLCPNISPSLHFFSSVGKLFFYQK